MNGKEKILNSIFLAIVVLGGLIFTFNFNGVFAQTVGITTTVKISVCGNNLKEESEVCDGTDLVGKTCQSFGFTHGILTCKPACDAFDTSNCYTPPSQPSGGGLPSPPPETGASFSGRAYPNQSVTLLKDAQVVATTIAGSDANFSIKITGLTAGNYIFSLYAEDHKGIRSSSLTFPLSITQGTITNVTGIFIAPSIDVDKSEVKRGDDIIIFGQSAPEANITIQISGSPTFFAQAISDKQGIYLHYFNTAALDYHTYYAKSKAAIGGTAVSSFSKAVPFLVGTKNVLKEVPTKCPQKGDLNNDCRVNLVDFSIAAYWYKRPLTEAFKVTEKERLNGDAKIDLVDFSIMAYYWTG